ncbi:ATP12 family chaperone protein [Pseudooceanicola algae]|uniref:Uncharacterized protein n=1 Tax=Pseudooceanicola algae TaxID=1537215 RepID=A0A418SKK8_9RHOB|nr:ATP12 family protein [Pseudooceanicola algae]QPM90764.1 hypothetical protein PSAL_020040 [Pseudooceanicola algae]
MSEWKARRFWKAADVVETPQGFSVQLDGRPVKTPAKAALALPSRALADRIAAEWQAQEDAIDPTSMPFMRTANSAIDKVATQHGEVAQLLADYGDSDLVCYRATSPVELVERQAAVWDPMLDWAATRLDARLEPRQGVIHDSQDPQALSRLSAQVAALSPFELAAFHDLVSLSGSLVLGFAAFLDAAATPEIWDMSRVDEDWQAEQWGLDDEAKAVADGKKVAFLHAKEFLDLVHG